jgi:hypothetical protein
VGNEGLKATRNSCFEAAHDLRELSEPRRTHPQSANEPCTLGVTQRQIWAFALARAPARDSADNARYYLVVMSDRPKDAATPSSEPVTQHRSTISNAEGEASVVDASSHVRTPVEFGAAESPTLSSPSSGPHSTNAPKELQSRIDALEAHVEAMERELAEVYGAVEHLVNRQEVTDRMLRQQRQGRYVMWGTLIAILAMLWLSLRSRLGIPGPR